MKVCTRQPPIVGLEGFARTLDAGKSYCVTLHLVWVYSYMSIP